MENCMAFSPNAETVYADGPSTAPRQPSKPEIRRLLKQYENIIEAFLSNGGLIYTSKAQMDADLAHGSKSSAWVIGDANVALNGIYQKQGASGVGSWTRVADLPYSFIIASDVGAGTPNAIQATTSIPVSGSLAQVRTNIFEANTSSPVTISFNGGSALTIKTSAGNDIAAGGLTAGMIILGVVSGSTFRLMSDQASAAIQAAAEAAQAAAEAAAATMPGVAANTIIVANADGLTRSNKTFDVVGTLLSGTEKAIQITNANTEFRNGKFWGVDVTGGPASGSFLYVNDLTTNPSGTPLSGRQFAYRLSDLESYTRALNNGTWGSWALTTDASGYGPYVRFWPDTSTSPTSTQRVRVGANDARIESVIVGSENNGWLNGVSPIGRGGVLGGTRTSDNPTAGDQGAQAVSAFGLQNDTVNKKPLYILYSEGRRSGGTRELHMAEFNLINLGNTVDLDPYNMSQDELTDTLRLTSGRTDVVGCTDISSFANLHNNGARAKKGVIFGSNSLVVSSGQADALNLAYQHALQWWTALGVRGPRIRSDVTGSGNGYGIVFANKAVFVQNESASNLLSIEATKMTSAGAIVFPQYTKAAKPSAAVLGIGATIYITDDASARRLAASDGTNWRFMDGAIVPAS